RQAAASRRPSRIPSDWRFHHQGRGDQLMQTATLTRRPTDAAEELETLRYRFMEMEDRYRKQALAMACALVSLVDLRDAYTGSHSSRVTGYARQMGLRMGLPHAPLDNVVMGAL